VGAKSTFQQHLLLRRGGDHEEFHLLFTEFGAYFFFPISASAGFAKEAWLAPERCTEMVALSDPENESPDKRMELFVDDLDYLENQWPGYEEELQKLGRAEGVQVSPSYIGAPSDERRTTRRRNSTFPPISHVLREHRCHQSYPSSTSSIRPKEIGAVLFVGVCRSASACGE